ncbi:hypothetical protein HK103_004539 [Boothiomyces macroporosus]|uniref:Uncharacterized protein n=1 Tax=Boothiomyces macroporosus TaxID=261099 RepID=A0AAD5UGH0_9FUNG|nr:hypothetical protein HK103_004539 [Boothiomyces macroporosus]
MQANESSRLSDISKEELLENREKIKLEAKIKKLGLMILDSSKVEKNGKSNNKSKRRQTWVPSSFNSPNLNTNNENDTDIDQMPSSEIMGIIMKMIKGEIKEEDVKSLELLKLHRYIQDLKDNASNTSNERSNIGSGDGEHKRMLEEETQVESKRLKTSHIDSNSDLLSQDMLEDELLRSLGVSTADDLYAYLNDCNKKLSEYEKLNSQHGDNLQKLHSLEEKLVDYNKIENERNDLIEQINQVKTMLMTNSNNGTDGLTLLELMTLEKNKVNAGIQYLSGLIVENHADDYEELDANLLGNIGIPSHHKLITILKEHKKTQELLSSLCTKYGLNDISLNSLLSYFEDERLSRGNAMEMKNSEFINLKNSYEELQTKYTNLEDEFKQKTEEKNLLDQDTETLRHSLETYQKTNEALLVDMNNLQLENAGLKSNLSTQRSEYERLKEEFTFKMDQTEEFEIKFGNEIFKCNTKNLIDDQIAIQNRIDEVLHLKESDSKELQQYRLIMNEICTSIGYNAEQWSPSEIKHQLDKVLAVELQKGKAIQLDYEQQLNDIAYSMGGEKLNTFEDLLKFFNTQVVPRAVHSETCKELEEKYQVALTMNEMSTKKIESILDANDSNSVKDVKIFKEYEQSVAENVELEKQLEDLKLSFVTLQSNSAELMELNKELTQALSSAQMENEALKSEIDAQQKMVLEKMDEQQILKQRIDDLVLASESNENAEQLKNAYLAQNEKVTDLNNQLNVLNSCLNEKNEFIASLQELVKQNNDAILLLDQELQEKSKMAESEISNLTQSLENSTKSLEHALIVQKNELESQWRDKYDQILNEFNQVSAEILEKNKQIEQLNVNLLQVGELQETLDAAKSNMEQLDSDRKCAEEFSNNLRKINRLIGITTGYMESTNARLKEHERKCDILSINGAHKSYFGVKQEKMKLDNKVSQYEGKIQDLGLQITSLNSINEDQITEKEKQIQKLENFIKSSLEENESLKASIETHLSKISDLFADNKLLKDSISQLNGELENIKSLQEENTQLRAKMRNLESEYSELKMQLSDKEAYLRTVQANIDVQKDRSNQENTLPNILPRKPLSNSVQEPVVI